MSIRFTSISRFINANHIARNNTSVSRNVVTTFKFYKVSDDNVTFSYGKYLWFTAFLCSPNDLNVFLIANFFSNIEFAIGSYLKDETYPG